MKHHLFACMLAGSVALTGCGEDDTAPPGPDPQVTVESILAGSFAPLPDFASSEAAGRAMLVRFADGTTEVSIHVNRLEPGTAYDAHVHALPCEFGAGGHYKRDPSIATAVEDNEIWPAFSTDDAGAATAAIAVEHRARGDAMSVVVHDPATGNKMLCADLVPDDPGDVATGGPVAPFASAEDAEQSISGMATLVRRGDTTIVSIDVSGLDPTAEYASHVHALPCDVEDAGGHYKRDPTVDTTEEANELWPSIVPDADGLATDSFEVVGHVAREDAQSIVVHRVTASGAPKVACADLVRGSYPELSTEGAAVALDQAFARGLDDLTGTATMTRRLTEQTAVELSVTGLVADTTYPAHVHNLPCDVESGGGHYQFDTSVTDALEENEIWLSIQTDGGGAGEAFACAEHLARPDAQSIVVHDPSDGARLACFDLD